MTERIPTRILPDHAQLAREVAHRIAAVIRARNADGYLAVLGLATGSTPIGVYRELVRMHREEGLSFARVATFNLDEYLPMEPESPHSYHRFMWTHLFSHIDIDPANVHLLDGRVTGAAIESHCAAFEAAIEADTNLFLLCHPHNPTGVAYRREDLARYGEICLRHNVVICSDEIHCDLLLDDRRHTPLAAISPEIAAQTITLMAPSKTFNLPGLKSSFAIVQNPELRARLVKACEGIVPHLNLFGLAAMQVAYSQCDDWLMALRAYLTSNRDVLLTTLRRDLPMLASTVPDATYLAWIDCRAAGIAGNPYQFFLREARVALNDGATFGPGGEGFVRLNFGCPRSTLLEALARMATALAR